MTERFFPARNASVTCSIDTFSAGNIHLHSIYNPEQEAERFVQGLPEGVYRYIVVTGPALSYCAPLIRKRFPSAYLMAVQFSPAFADTDKVWDRVFLFLNRQRLSEGLFSVIGEEDMGSTLFVSWKPSEAAYPAEYAETWEAIAEAVRKSRDVLGTRCFFNRRWSVNAVRFCIGLEKAALLQPGTSPVVIAAAGPTLECSFGFLKHNRESLYIMALSSALLPLLSAGIIPDCCVSIDGGFWAQHHLLPLCAAGAPDVPVILSAESSVPSGLFEKQRIIPLRYGDGPETFLLERCGIPALPARRNGTVAGTAAELALSVTSGKVYAMGLDLAEAAGRNHARPNMLDEVRNRYTGRLCPLGSGEPSRNGALDIYAQWFASRGAEFTERFFRVKPVPRPIPSIREAECGDIPAGDINTPAGKALSLSGTELQGTPPRCVSAGDIPSREHRRKAVRSLIAEKAARFAAGDPGEWLSGRDAVWAAAGALPRFIRLRKEGTASSHPGNGSAEAVRAEMAEYFARLDERAARYDR